MMRLASAQVPASQRAPAERMSLLMSNVTFSSVVIVTWLVKRQGGCHDWTRCHGSRIYGPVYTKPAQYSGSA